MRILAITIEGFRGVKSASICVGDHSVLVGANGAGKTTIIDALSLAFGRVQLVRDLTEHDFYGSCPDATSRINIFVVLGGFAENDPDRNPAWFSHGRAVPKWWNPSRCEAVPSETTEATELCAEIAFTARFDLEELEIESRRYFRDDPSAADPFDDENPVIQVPQHLLSEIGYYVLPVRRTWEATASFASDLFRKAVATVGGVPAATLLAERDRLRSPAAPLEKDARLKPLVDSINGQLKQLLPSVPQFQLRLTATDSDALLKALVPHYLTSGCGSLPAGRQGTGLLSLQTFLLLLEIGRARKAHGDSFILAMEEPELHLAPGLQRRLLAEAVSVASQTVCSSHSPRIAAFYPATSVVFIERTGGDLKASKLLAQPLDASTPQSARKFYNDERARVVEALMHHRVLVPEGRGDYEWFRVLANAAETGDAVFGRPPRAAPPFAAMVGVIPTHDSAVVETYGYLKPLREGIVPLVDGDAEGDSKISALQALAVPPPHMLQWPKDWEIEDVICWILGADEATAMPQLKERLPAYTFANLGELLALFKAKASGTRIKTDYLAYEEVAAVIRETERCRERAAEVLEAVTDACAGPGSPKRFGEDARSTANCKILVFQP